MPFANLSTGVQLHYEDIGTGEVVIAVHGFLGTPRTDLGNVIDWLRRDYRVIAPTLRGYGESRPPQRDFPATFYERDAADVLALADALDLDGAHLVGYSDGGEVALLGAGRHSTRFRSVAVWGSVGYFGPAMRAAAQRLYPATWIPEETLQRHGIENANAFVLNWIQAIKGMIDAGGDVSLHLADKIECPLLLMLGDNDTLNPIAYGQRFVDRTPNGHLQTFACGHAVHTEQWGAFQKALGEFLRNS